MCYGVSLLNKANLSTWKEQIQQLQQQVKTLENKQSIQIKPSDIKVEGVNTKNLKITTEPSKK